VQETSGKQENKKNVPVIFLTAKTEKDDIVKGFEVGGQDYITKPFDARELMERVKTQIELKTQREILKNLTEVLEQKVQERTAELKESNKNLDKANTQLLTLDEAKNKFLMLISHEIRTPLNSVIGFAELLSNSVSDPQQLNHLKIIKSSGRTLLTLINDLLDLSKIEAGKFEIDYENIIIGDIFEDISQIFLHRTLEKNISLVTNISQELPETIYFSGLRLRQILFNLVGNAIKFTSKGSITITVNVKNVDLSNKINLYITIEDTGIGIHEHELQKII